MKRELIGRPGVDFGIEDVRGSFPEEIEIRPLEKPPDATISVPGSKSVTNRALLIAALSDGDSTLENPLLSDDPFWLMSALTDLGFDLEATPDAIHITGQSGIIPKNEVDIYVGNAGTVARFLPPSLALGRGPYGVDGVARMRERPISDLVDAMRSLGAAVEYGEDEGRFPLVVGGGGIEGGRVKVEGRKSSQFLSGVMISAPYAERPVTLEVDKDMVHRSYVGITTEVMSRFGVEVGGSVEEGEFRIRPSVYRAGKFHIEPDASGASYFFAAAAVTGGRVRVGGLGSGSTQGDLRFVEVLDEMGCEVEVGEAYTEVRGPERLGGVEIDMNDISDTMITLAAIAPFARTKTRITNVEHARNQETDRIRAVSTELSRLGIEVKEQRDGLEISPGEPRPALINTYDDHRMAMAFSLIGLKVPGVRIRNPECVTKTLPDFFERLEGLRR